MKLLMIGHLLGDFYFQTNKMVEKKKESFWSTATHCLIYAMAICLVLFLVTGKIGKYILPVLIIGVLHFFIDSTKMSVNKVYETPKMQLTVFVIDQIIHILILFFASRVLIIEPNMEWNLGVFGKILIEKPIAIFMFLFCGKPAAIIVSLVFGLIPNTIVEAEKQNVAVTDNQNNDVKTTESKKKESAKIGSWIGILEREIILILGLLGEYEAIGFVIAAKSLARHSQFDNKAFAEKYLVGTLLSTLIAILGIVLCSIF